MLLSSALIIRREAIPFIRYEQEMYALRSKMDPANSLSVTNDRVGYSVVAISNDIIISFFQIKMRRLEKSYFLHAIIFWQKTRTIYQYSLTIVRWYVYWCSIVFNFLRIEACGYSAVS